MSDRELEVAKAAEDAVSGQRQKARGERTRQALIDAAFEEIHRNGYRAASLNDILTAAGCTKGSLYHHFPDKHALGLAAISEHIDRYITENWVTPLSDTDDPLSEIRHVIERYAAGRTEADLALGCPVNNLSQEMSPVDEDFRLYLAGILSGWRDAIEKALERGQKAGTVRTDIDVAATAAMVVATHQGTIGTAKTARSRDVARRCCAALFDYLDHLRPPAGRDL